jgi:hypothetical protein
VWTLRRARPDGPLDRHRRRRHRRGHGVVAGNALNWRYTLDLDGRQGKLQHRFDDWMFLIDERVMLNRAVMSFWGFRVGEVLISFTRKLSEPESPDRSRGAATVARVSSALFGALNRPYGGRACG